MWFSRYQLVNVGFAPQILQKLWASENGPTHYLDSWVKIWATCTPPMPLTSIFSKTIWNFDMKSFVQIFLNIKAHMSEVSSKFEMVTWRFFLKIASLEPEWPYSKSKYFCYQKSTPQIIFLVFARCAVLIHGGLLTMGRLCSLCHSGGDFISPFKSVFFSYNLNWNLCYNELVDICHLPIKF